MCEQKFSIIILNDNKISIPRQFRKIGSLSPFIFNKLLNDPFTYVIKSSISQNTLNSFLAYLCEDAELKISIDNYFELMQISDEFQLQDLKNLLLEKKRIWEYYERILENLENKQNAFEIMQKGLEQKQKDFGQLDQYIKHSMMNLIQILIGKVNGLKLKVNSYLVQAICIK